MNLLFAAMIASPIILFITWFYKKPTSLWTGFFFLIFLVDIGLLVIFTIERFNERLALVVVTPIAILLIIIGIFGIYAMIIGLFWNERILLKYERRSFSNFLPLIVATFLLILQLILFFGRFYNHNKYFLSLFTLISSLYSYFSLIFLLYTITAILYNYFPMLRKVDYIIVLGAGLNKDKVTPLLAARIKAGLTLYQRQVAKLGHHPTIILSGGQGEDELISEAAAMNNYIKQEGYNISNIYLEDQSTNTAENIAFSEKIAQKNDGIESFKEKQIVIATNNYHLLRAGKLAHAQGILARGVGAKTRWYYIPTAFTREYIGYLVMTRNIHIAVILFLFISALLPLIFT